MLQLALGARTRLSHLAQAMGLHVAAGEPARRLLHPTKAMAAKDADAERTLVSPRAAQASPGAGGADKARLALGLDAVREAVAGKTMRLNEVLNLVLETVHQALDLRCVVFCLREPRSGHLVGRVALGVGSSEIRAAFCVAPEAAAGTDLFAAVCAKGADLLIADASTVAKRLPAWYRQRVNAPTFLLLPMQLKGSLFGLIYADKAVAGTIQLDETELALLRALRDQAVAAFGKGSG